MFFIILNRIFLINFGQFWKSFGIDTNNLNFLMVETRTSK